MIYVAENKQVARFRNKIWCVTLLRFQVPPVRKYTRLGREVEAPAVSRIFKEMTLVTKEKSAGKGKMMKKAPMALYASETDALCVPARARLLRIRVHGMFMHRYASIEASAKAGMDVPLPTDWSQVDWV